MGENIIYQNLIFFFFIIVTHASGLSFTQREKYLVLVILINSFMSWHPGVYTLFHLLGI